MVESGVEQFLPEGYRARAKSYQIARSLGCGGFGCTYEATNLHIENLRLALKEYFPFKTGIALRASDGIRIEPFPGQDENFSKWRRAFVQEAKALQDLVERTRHPNVVQLRDFYEENDTAYLVMEFVDGVPLAEEIPAGRASHEQIRRLQSVVFPQIVDALEAVHTANLVHLDIKPENVLVEKGKGSDPDRIILIDFGGARIKDAPVKNPVWTPSYAPPELIERGTVSPASDVYALGVTLHQLLTGQLPEDFTRRPDPWSPDLPEPWKGLIRAALRHRPADRPESALKWWRAAGLSATRGPERPARKAPAAVSTPSAVHSHRSSAITLNGIQEFLHLDLWLNVMDFISVYAAPRDRCLDEGWMGLCETYSLDPRYLVYVNEDGIQRCFDKEISRARLDPEGTQLSVELMPTSQSIRNADEIYSDVVRDRVLKPHEELSAGRYQICEAFSAFSWKVITNIKEFQPIYSSYLGMLERLQGAASVCAALQRSLVPGPNYRRELLAAFCRRDIPFMSIQGPPGTGKTTFIADAVDSLLSQGVKASEIACIAFTRRATEEIMTKLAYAASNSAPGSGLRMEHLPPFSPGKPPDVKIEDCTGKLYVGTVHKNPGLNRNGILKRSFLIIDEASQLNLPLQLYAFRYARTGAAIRLVGDQEQLPPTTTFIRDFELVRNLESLGFNELQRQFIKFDGYRNGQKFIDVLEATCRALFSEGPWNRDLLASEDLLRRISVHQAQSIYRQSLLSLPEYVAAVGVQGQLADLAQNLRACRFPLVGNFRQESSLHTMTKNVFYPALAGHVCAVDLAGRNADEVKRLGQRTDLSDQRLEELAGFLTTNFALVKRLGAWAKNFWEGAKGLKERLGNLFGHRARAIGGALSPDELRQCEKDVRPLVGRDRLELAREVKRYADATLTGSTELQNWLEPRMEGSIASDAFLSCLERKIVVIRHDFRERRSRGVSEFEAWLAVLILSLWKGEHFRISQGLGAVTPFRRQEALIFRKFARAFPDDEFVKRQNWVATPERYQGSDLSRTVVSLVTTGDKAYLEPTTMFNKNKGNVATSRAGSQLVIIGHRDLFSQESFENYTAMVDKLEEPMRTIVRLNSLLYRQKLVEIATHCRENPTEASIFDVI